MDKKQAQALIKGTFESTFDKDRFISFVKNLLNDVEEATFIYKGNYIPDAYEQYIVSYERIGKYKNGDNRIDILIVRLNREASIERARTMQRNFIAGYLQGKYGSTAEKEGALVAFVAPNEEDWRFSLVKMDYRFEESKKGRMRVKEEFTPARRWSFLVGINERSHTAQSQLVDLVADDESNPAIAQLEEAFNIEKVTKEFFEKYRELFLWTEETLEDIVKKDKKIKGDFEAKKVNTVDFSKKLLGQIVFLYFLQKKGWFGVKRDADWRTGPKNFLRELFESKHGTYKNFFNDILEPLFYEALRIDRSHDDDYYSKLNCRIPFLNGGLFDPINSYDWVHTDILLPDDLFSNSYKTKEGDKGNGILDIFDRYNFTVKEDEPLEKEVAVDPEMLGKVFENLLEVKDRKSKGTYYTPREIVHYMCQQSLINYLATELEGKVSKEDIETLVKHGEHLGENETTVEAKGRETSTYFYKLPESIRQHAELIDERLINIKVCDPAIGSGAFPVGMMSEIVKTRNVLSAYIKSKDRSVYSFKRECIEKSLYGVDIDSSAVEIAKLRLWLSLVVEEDDIKQIKPLPNLDYKIVCGDSLLSVEKDLFNSHLFNELERLKPLLFNEVNPSKKHQFKKQIDELIRQITRGHKEFDFEVYFSEVFHEKGGFDFVIANPPYIGYNESAKQGQQLFRDIKNKRISLNNYCSFNLHSIPGNPKKYAPKPNLYAFFIAKGVSLIKKNGVFCYIIPQTLLVAGDLDVLRYHISNKLTVNKIMTFIDNVFEKRGLGPDHDVATSSLLIFLQKKEPAKNNVEVINLSTAEKGRGRILGVGFTQNTHNQTTLVEEVRNWGFIKWDSDISKLLTKIISNSLPCSIYYDHKLAQKTFDSLFYFDKGLVFLKNKIIDKNKAKRPFYFQVKLEKNSFITTETGKVVERKHIKFPHGSQGEIVLAQSYKIIWSYMNFNHFYYSDQNIVVDFNHVIISSNNDDEIRFLFSLLNSKLINLLLNQYLRLENEKSILLGIKSIKEYLRIPISNEANLKYKNEIISLTDKIISFNKSSNFPGSKVNQAKAKDCQRQIDQIAYKLYGLTKDEIKIIEDFSNGD